MEISGSKYLHKKFKKQTSCSPAYNVENNIQSSDCISNGQNKEEKNVKENECEDESVSKRDIEILGADTHKDNKDAECVPNLKSTNCEYNVAKTLKTDNVNRVNVIPEHQSSISNLDSASSVVSQENEVNSRTASNIISKPEIILSSSILLGNDLKENHFSFDIKHSNTPHIIDKSSSIDITYSKYSLLSERPNLFNVVQNDENGKNSGKSDGEVTVVEPVEKKQSCAESSVGKYVCTYCNLACSKPSVLQKHIRAHTNERPYPCVSCGFSFKTRSNLYKHCRSRTHANRVMGNKHNQNPLEGCVDLDISSEKSDEKLEVNEDCEEKNARLIELSDNLNRLGQSHVEKVHVDQKNIWEQKSKPYKPKFHTAKLFFEENKKNDKVVDSNVPNLGDKKIESTEAMQIKANSDLLKLRINELINKNNSIVNCDDAVVIRRRNNENGYTENVMNNDQSSVWQQLSSDYKPDEPLNLTAKNRKRCLSDSENSQKSLIKELLLKNLSSDPNLQCQYCRMIFQTVPELEMHKLKYCTAYNKGNNVRYARSSSVNVASILTHNKNAFDNIPHMQNTTFSLKSPGPFLGKTRLIENDRTEKYRIFSFDDNAILHHTHNESTFNKYMFHSPGYPLSPQVKKNPIKLFGGEVKITQTSGETRSYKIESENSSKISGETENLIDFGPKMSENLVIKSSLQSGGTVLQNKSNYVPKLDTIPSSNILRYDNTNIASPNLNLTILNENKFNYDETSVQNDRLLTVANQITVNKSPSSQEGFYTDNILHIDLRNEDKEKELYKSNLIDFSQKAIKLLTPNLKAPNLSIPGLPVPSLSSEKLYSSVDLEKDKRTVDNLNFAKKQINLQQQMLDVPAQNIYNPVNLLVNGKVIRYVPGIPGPIVDAPVEFAPVTTTKIVKSPKDVLKSPKHLDEIRETKEAQKSTPASSLTLNIIDGNRYENKTPVVIISQHDNSQEKNQVVTKVKSDFEKKKELETIEYKPAENKTVPLTISISSPEKISKEEVRKFVRPNSLALKPSSVAFKSHHGLTPTLFNQALISPDTPRVAKKYCQQYLNGNYFSYLGLKSSTKSVYCTLNKTQPFYVKHFKKLSMYSEWRQQESKIDSLSVSAYDSRQRQPKYTMAGFAKADLIVHSSYKFIMPESSFTKDELNNKNNSILGGYESNEDYTYIRGRGRGRYVCDQCGIRCKKPSMLKKHIRTHSDDRPYTCQHCNFSFKTKGNLTKHMKSKAHSKKYAETSSTSTQNSITTSSESEDSDAESSDESTRLQEHEAAHCLLSLAQKNSPLPSSSCGQDRYTLNVPVCFNLTDLPNILKDSKFLKNSDQITQVTNTNFAKNKIMDENMHNFNTAKHLTEAIDVGSCSNQDNLSQYLGKSSAVRPLTYPYQQTQIEMENAIPQERLLNNQCAEGKLIKEVYSPVVQENIHSATIKSTDKNMYEGLNKKNEETSMPAQVLIKQVGTSTKNDFNMQNLEGNLPASIVFRKRKLSVTSNFPTKKQRVEDGFKPIDLSSSIIIRDSPILDLSPASNTSEPVNLNGMFLNKNDGLAVPVVNSPKSFDINLMGAKNVGTMHEQITYTNIDKPMESTVTFIPAQKRFLNISKTVEENSNKIVEQSYANFLNQKQRINNISTNSNTIEQDTVQNNLSQNTSTILKPRTNSGSSGNSKAIDESLSHISNERSGEPLINFISGTNSRHNSFSESNSSETFSQNSDINDKISKVQEDNLSFNIENPSVIYKSNASDILQSQKIDYEQDQSAMQTLAEIAIKQMKTEKNIMAKSVASEYLKLALKNEYNSNCDENCSDSGIKKFVSTNKETNELIVKSEENKNCSICSKNFSKPSQLRLHMNIHYLERPYRCESCSVSFRTKGHLQKHERSTTHHNKLSSSPALSSSEPRPFKCSDCNIAFRIHGHLAKHLRSKMHIMKLECLAKIPFGLYAELERANSLLTEINTTDGDLCLESLKILARKLFSNDPNKLDQLTKVPEGRDS